MGVNGKKQWVNSGNPEDPQENGEGREVDDIHLARHGG